MTGNKRRREREKERDIFKLASTRKRKTKKLDHVRCKKSNGQKVLVRDNDIKERWRNILTNF